RAPEGDSVLCMVNRLHECCAHEGRAAQYAIQAGIAGHPNQRSDTPARFTDRHATGILKLDFCAGVRAVAELVLELHKAHCIAASIWQPPRHKETRRFAVELSQNQMSVGSRH